MNYLSGRQMHNNKIYEINDVLSKDNACKSTCRYDWETDEIIKIHNMPLMDLLFMAHNVHRQFHKKMNIQLASLMNIKTGGCPEDCKYCSQSAHYAKTTGLKKQNLMQVSEIIKQAKIAKKNGANRFCIGTAWRKVSNDEDFKIILAVIKKIRELDMEACATLGMLNQSQANDLAYAGLSAYNHNLDTSPEFYGQIITTRTFNERLKTLKYVRNAGIDICSGGIIGLGESIRDRARLIQILASLSPHPESVPINALVPVKGTPLENNKPVESIEIIRMIATSRIVIPKARIRLSAGRKNLSKEAQIICFYAGANSIFYGDKLLTTKNNNENDDLRLLKEIGLDVIKN